MTDIDFLVPTRRRWRWVYCIACEKSHGLNNDAMLLVIERSQLGELITASGKSLCILGALEKPFPDRLVEVSPDHVVEM